MSVERLDRRTILIGGVAATAALGNRALAQAPAYRFGLAMPLTGGQALYGSDQIQAAEWAVADINKAGGVNGKRLEVLVLDTQADPQVGIQAANRLVNAEKMPVFVTAWSAVAKAVAPIANDAKVLQLVVGANSPAMSKLGDYVYTTYPLADVDLTALVKYHYDQGKRKAAVLYVNDETGVTAAQLYRDRFTALGGQVVAFEAFDPKASDYTGQILKARAANPETIHIQAQVSDTPQVIAQMRQLGLQQLITSYAAIYHPRFISSLGAASEGVMVTSLAPSVNDSTKVADYVERWKKEKGREPNGLPYTQYLYDAPFFVAKLFETLDRKGGPITGDTMRSAMLDVKRFDLPLTGLTEIRPDHTVTKPVDLMQVQGGKWVRVTTISA